MASVGSLVTEPDTFRGGGVGGGPPSLDPYLLGSFFEA